MTDGAAALVGPVRSRLLERELDNLHGRLAAQIDEDARLCGAFLDLRRRALAHQVRDRNAPSPPAEFNAVFARYYIAARNAISRARDCLMEGRAATTTAGHGSVSPPDAGSAAELRLCFAKMQAELGEKGMAPLPWDAPEFEEPLPPTSLRLIKREAEGAEELADHDREDSPSRACVYGIEECPDLTMTVPGRVRVRLLASALAFLRARCGRPVAARGLSSSRSSPNRDVADAVYHATVLNYLVASSTLYWGFGPEVYDVAREGGAVLECYASPFNNSLPYFCSPCAPLDMVYGSLGSFYSDRVDAVAAELFGSEGVPPGRCPATFVANPPYVETELLACAERVRELVAAARVAGGRLRFVSIFPAWPGAAGLRSMRDLGSAAGHQGATEGVVVEVELCRGAYFYYDYQQDSRVEARFRSVGFAVGYSTQDVWEARRIFDAMLRSTEQRGRETRRPRPSHGGASAEPEGGR